jgi:hypothetical protein
VSVRTEFLVLIVAASSSLACLATPCPPPTTAVAATAPGITPAVTTRPPPPPDDPARCLTPPPASASPTPEPDSPPDWSTNEEPASIVTSGRMAPELIRAIVRSHYSTFRECYASGLARHPTLQGRFTFRFAITPEGKVSNLVVADNTLPDCAVVACVHEAMSLIRYPHPEGGVVTVHYPIQLQPD